MRHKLGQMNAAGTKKDEERHFLTEFLRLHPGLDASALTDAEEPDFLCLAAGQPTGIEVTRFFFPTSSALPPQALSRYRREFGHRLRTNHARSGLPPVTVSVYMANDSALLNEIGRAALEKALFDFVGRKIPFEGSPVTFDFLELPDALGDLGVNAVSILRHSKITEPFWSLPEASFVPKSESPLIQTILDKKNRRVSVYRRKAAAVWLVIISGTEGLHSIVDFDGDILTATYATTFDRVFLFRTFGPSTHELKIGAVR
jgi:hypothetical protein